MELKTNAKVETAFFEAEFRKYVKAGIRGAKQAIIDKLFMVARKASWWTDRVQQKEIAKSLGTVTARGHKDGRRRYHHRLVRVESERYGNAPLIALIINSRIEKGKGFKGAGRFSEMRAKIEQVMRARVFSTAYTASGWLTAIQKLAPLASIKTKSTRADADIKHVGREKGRSEIEESPDFLQGLIENSAWAKRDKTGAFEKYAWKGLQIAFDSEAKDTKNKVEEYMQEATDAFNNSQRWESR